MERVSIDKNELHQAYWNYIVGRSEEYVQKRLTGRLVIDFQKGKINSVFDQAVVAGVSALAYYHNKIE